MGFYRLASRLHGYKKLSSFILCKYVEVRVDLSLLNCLTIGIFQYIPAKQYVELINYNQRKASSWNKYIFAEVFHEKWNIKLSDMLKIGRKIFFMIWCYFIEAESPRKSWAITKYVVNMHNDVKHQLKVWWQCKLP